MQIEILIRDDMGIDAQSHPNQSESLGLSIALEEKPHQSCLDQQSVSFWVKDLLKAISMSCFYLYLLPFAAQLHEAQNSAYRQ